MVTEISSLEMMLRRRTDDDCWILGVTQPQYSILGLGLSWGEERRRCSFVSSLPCQ
jgi:hypothetical protein